jgi:predicted enzyme related to lactoylglutathione lyase
MTPSRVIHSFTMTLRISVSFRSPSRTTGLDQAADGTHVAATEQCGKPACNALTSATAIILALRFSGRDLRSDPGSSHFPLLSSLNLPRHERPGSALRRRAPTRTPLTGDRAVAKRAWPIPSLGSHELADGLENIGKDPAKLRSYFGDLFGWEFDTGSPVAKAVSEPMNYGFMNRITTTDGTGIPGGVGGGAGYEGHVVFYVGVPDVEAALQKAESPGGKRRMARAGADRPRGRPLHRPRGQPDRRRRTA